MLSMLHQVCCFIKCVGLSSVLLHAVCCMLWHGVCRGMTFAVLFGVLLSALRGHVRHYSMAVVFPSVLGGGCSFC